MSESSEIFPPRQARDYERPEDRIPYAEEDINTEPGEPRGASNQQLDMGSAQPGEQNNRKDHRQ
jgi:hypothetical protein